MLQGFEAKSNKNTQAGYGLLDVYSIGIAPLNIHTLFRECSISDSWVVQKGERSRCWLQAGFVFSSCNFQTVACSDFGV
jgi:hypothetical protein